MGDEKNPAVGSSGEFWSISESLNQHGTWAKGFVINREGYGSCKPHPRVSTMMFTREESRANNVPAAAVIH